MPETITTIFDGASDIENQIADLDIAKAILYEAMLYFEKPESYAAHRRNHVMLLLYGVDNYIKIAHKELNAIAERLYNTANAVRISERADKVQKIEMPPIPTLASNG